MISGTLLNGSSRPRAADLLREDVVEAILGSRLPGTWHVKTDVNPIYFGPDALVSIESPSGKTGLITLEVKALVEPRDVPGLVAELRRNTSGPALVLTSFLSPAVQEDLIEAGIGYADLTGNVYVAVEDPPVFIRDKGAASDPWREPRPIHSLKGPTAGRVVRALCDLRPPYGVRELAQRSETPASSVSRVVTLLDREALVERRERGEITNVDWARLIQRWTQDYSLSGSNRIYTFLAARGLQQLLNTFDELYVFGRRYAITGSFAAAEVAPYAPPRLLTIYAENAEKFAADLDLRPTETGANVVVAEPFDSVVFDRTWTREDRTYAALSQVAADLLTSPGRSPAEGEELLRWMAEHEDAWRS